MLFFTLKVPKSTSMPSLQRSVVTQKEAVSVGNTPTQSKSQITVPATSPSNETQPSPQQEQQKSGFFSRLFKGKDKEALPQKQEPIGRCLFNFVLNLHIFCDCS